jgi:hypothetical protein
MKIYQLINNCLIGPTTSGYTRFYNFCHIFILSIFFLNTLTRTSVPRAQAIEHAFLTLNNIKIILV